MKYPAAFLLDLDDTLFSEHDFVFSGYRALAVFVAEETGLSAENVYRYLRHTFYKFGRVGAFDRMMAHFKVDFPPIKEMVTLYRDHTPDIALYPNVLQVLERLRRGAKLAIVTDGTASVQAAKIAALGLEPYVDAIVLCWEINAPKPDPAGFRLAAETLNVAIEDCIIVGDDPLHDMAAARDLGIPSLRVCTGRFANLESEADDDHTGICAKFSDIEPVLAEITR